MNAPSPTAQHKSERRGSFGHDLQIGGQGGFWHEGMSRSDMAFKMEIKELSMLKRGRHAYINLCGSSP